MIGFFFKGKKNLTKKRGQLENDRKHYKEKASIETKPKQNKPKQHSKQNLKLKNFS